MISNSTTLDFAPLLADATVLLEKLNRQIDQASKSLQHTILSHYKSEFSESFGLISLHPESLESPEPYTTDWLIYLFNNLFAEQNVALVRGDGEPEYFPATANHPARIEFAHGFFASALHEISHWCVAGQRRRQLSDFGYWYAPDGRTATQQQAFERVEIKPQAIECLFTLACQRPFQVSQDNLFADFDTSNSTFAQEVYQQVKHYIAKPETLPRDAQFLLTALLTYSTSNHCNNYSDNKLLNPNGCL